MSMTLFQRSENRLKLLAAIVAGTLILLATIIAVRPASATGQTLAVCTANVTLNLSPGLLLLAPTSGTNQSFGETGTLSCTGTFEGSTITGPGTLGFSATYSGTCASVAGGGTWFFTIPTSNGAVHRSGTYAGPAVGSIIFFNGHFPGGKLAGTGTVVPVTGDCLTSPMTKATFNFLGLQLSQ